MGEYPSSQRYYVTYVGLGVHSTSSILVIVQALISSPQSRSLSLYVAPTSNVPGVPSASVFVKIIDDNILY